VVEERERQTSGARKANEALVAALKEARYFVFDQPISFCDN
jgi:hypothetical protein